MSTNATSSLSRGVVPPAVSTLPPPSSDRARYNRVGLINQGATCYLNSLLQVLYNLSYFRSAVYHCVGDATAADGSSKIPAALQELFFQMQESNHAPKTEGLTRSFGWSEHEVFQQHDIHEMLTLLRDELESRMKNTPSQGAINKLFEGKVENVIATLDGSYVSRRPEVFFDIQLEVAGYRSVMDSLRSLTKKDQLTGDNKYKVEEEGRPAVFKDAEKGLTYTRFPPVLCFHLKRFEMDLMSPNLDMRKINDRFEFSETLDLRDIEKGGGDEEAEKEKEGAALPALPLKENVAPSSHDEGDNANNNTNNNNEDVQKRTTAAAADLDSFSEKVPPIYDLHSVIVHKGGVNNGHYYCYVREVKPKKKKDVNAIAAEAGLNSDSANPIANANKHVDPMASVPAGDTSAPSGAAPADGASDASAATSAATVAATATPTNVSAAEDTAATAKLTANNNNNNNDTTAAEELDFEEGGQWYEFDDDHVRAVSSYEAIDGNFGGRQPAGGGGGYYGSYGGGGGSVIAIDNAYMLTYVRRGYWQRVMRPTPTDAIPQRVKDEFRRVMEEEERARREAEEEAMRCHITVIDDSHIFDHTRRMSFDLISTSSRSADAEFGVVPGAVDSRSSRLPRGNPLVMKKTDRFSALYDRLQEQYGYDKNSIRLRSWTYHFDNPKASYRPSRHLLSFDEASGTIEEVLRAAGVVEAAHTTTNTNNNNNSSSSAHPSHGGLTSKPIKVTLYVEQKRVMPLKPAPAILFGDVTPLPPPSPSPSPSPSSSPDSGDAPPAKKSAGVDECDDAAEKEKENNDGRSKSALNNNTNTNSSRRVNPISQQYLSGSASAPTYDGSYSINLIVNNYTTQGTGTAPSIIAEAVASSHHDPQQGPALLLPSLRTRKSVTFSARDAKPTLTVCLDQPRILHSFAIRLAVSKNAPPTQYMLHAEGFANVDEYNRHRPLFRYSPQTVRLPTNSNGGSNATVLHLTGNEAQYPALTTRPVRVVSFVVTPNTQYVPIVFLSILGMYANDAAEAALSIANKKAQLRALADLTTARNNATATSPSSPPSSPPSSSSSSFVPASLLPPVAAADTALAAANTKRDAAKVAASLTAAIAYLEARAPTMPAIPSLPPLPSAVPRTVPSNATAPAAGSSNILLMLKAYTPNPANGEHIRYIGPLIVDEREPPAAYAEPILHMMGIPIDRLPASERTALASKLRFYDEQRPSSIVALEPYVPFLHQELIQGNAMIVEMCPSTRSSLYRLPTLVEFWNQHSERIFVNIRLFSDPAEPLFQCPMDLRWAYHQVCECIAARAAEFLTLNGGGDGGAPSPSPSPSSALPSPSRDRLNASLNASRGDASHAAGTPLIDADKVILYHTLDTYAPMPSNDPIVSTSRAGATLRSMLCAHGGRTHATDLFFDVVSVPRLVMELQVRLRAVLADDSGEIYTDALNIVLPPGATPPQLVQAVFAAARATDKVRESVANDKALWRLARDSEAFCLVGTRDNRIVAFWDNYLLSNGSDISAKGRDDGSGSGNGAAAKAKAKASGCPPPLALEGCDDESEEAVERAYADDCAKAAAMASSSSSSSSSGGVPPMTVITSRRSPHVSRQLARLYGDNLKPLDPTAYTANIVYQLRPIDLLPLTTEAINNNKNKNGAKNKRSRSLQNNSEDDDSDDEDGASEEDESFSASNSDSDSDTENDDDHDDDSDDENNSDDDGFNNIERHQRSKKKRRQLKRQQKEKERQQQAAARAGGGRMLRMYIGFCDCPDMKYTRQAPLFNTPIVITISEKDTLSMVWEQLRRKNPEIIKGAREAPQTRDSLCIKFVMYTDQALSFHDWDSIPANQYFVHTENRSGYRPMLCINKPRPKEVKGPRYGSSAEPKLRLGGGPVASPSTAQAPAQ